jgi:protein-S-isoprenylcysteine O-methyltransferase Ste14
VLSVAGWMFLFLGITRYDLGKFAGTESLRRAKNDLPPEDEQALITTGIHGYVRHPLYGAAILALWGAAWTPFGFWTAVFASAYLLIGAKLEERRLIQRFGSAYAEYHPVARARHHFSEVRRSIRRVKKLPPSSCGPDGASGFAGVGEEDGSGFG